MRPQSERVRLALRRHVRAQRRFEHHAIGVTAATVSTAVTACLQPTLAWPLWATFISTASLGAVVLGFLWEERAQTESVVRASLLIELSKQYPLR
ncbi:hypothetical protein L2Y96_12580 [Luteibacter aegosomaticola]|uniref:hypothetical protein n=1 Tax=Luteibacter aegosomaticola TaxID=2911538 RepID=UPI001FF97DB5|nr:hypothetical protein [Luteibacter aegosomaticola]UPG88255.1 hypothetical protein L2Y96_12580 [Luteibacter aegosomaticola]